MEANVRIIADEDKAVLFWRGATGLPIPEPVPPATAALAQFVWEGRAAVIVVQKGNIPGEGETDMDVNGISVFYVDDPAVPHDKGWQLITQFLSSDPAVKSAEYMIPAKGTAAEGVRDGKAWVVAVYGKPIMARAADGPGGPPDDMLKAAKNAGVPLLFGEVGNGEFRIIDDSFG